MTLIEQMKKAGMKLKPNHLTPREKAIRMLELKALWAEEAEKAKNKTPDSKQSIIKITLIVQLYY